MTEYLTKWAKLCKELRLSGGSELDDAQVSSAAFGTMFRGRDDSSAHATETWSSLREEVLAHEHCDAAVALKVVTEREAQEPATTRQVSDAAVLMDPPRQVEMPATTSRRSVWQGPFVDSYVLKKAERAKSNERNEIIKVWSRRSTIIPQFVGLTFGVYNGKKHIPVTVTEEMIGQTFGEYSPISTRFGHHAKRILGKGEKSGSKK